jgi:hypothetical protein
MGCQEIKQELTNTRRMAGFLLHVGYLRASVIIEIKG